MKEINVEGGDDELGEFKEILKLKNLDSIKNYKQKL